MSKHVDKMLLLDNELVRIRKAYEHHTPDTYPAMLLAHCAAQADEIKRLRAEIIDCRS